MTWDQQALNAALDEALAGGSPAWEPPETSLRQARALRSALYNRAKSRGVQARLSFSIEDSRRVVLRLKEFRGLKRAEI